MNFIVKGKHDKISKEEIRAMFQATSCILEFHKQVPIAYRRYRNGDNGLPEYLKYDNSILVKIISDKDYFGKTKTGSKSIGHVFRYKGFIEIASWKSFNTTFAMCIHEVIHLYFDFPNDMCEKLTSTLTAKLKPTIAKVYEVLIDGVYQRAAFIAHTKIAYRPKGDDYYDNDQYKELDIKTVKKYRRKENGKK